MWYLRPRLIVHNVCRDLSSVLLCKHAVYVTVIMDVVEGLSVPVCEVVQCHKSGYLLYVCVGEPVSTRTQCSGRLLLRMGFRRTDE